MSRKKRIGTALLTCVACIFCTESARADGIPQPPPPVALTMLKIEDAINLGLSRNERSRVADLNDVVADAAVEKARAGFLPVVTLTGSDTQRGEAKPPNLGTGAVGFNQPLINIPAWPLYSAAKRNFEGQQAQTIDDKRLLAFDVAKAFLFVLNAQEVLLAAQGRLKSAKADKEDTAARAEAQLTSVNDVTRAEIALASAAREVESDKGTLDAAYVALELLLNARITRLVPPDATLEASKKPLPPVAELVQSAVDHRQDVLAKKLLAQGAHDSASEPLLRIIPTLNLVGQTTGTTNVPTGGKPNEETLGINLSWTIYDAGSRYADKHSRDAQAEIADLTLITLVRTVDSQVRSAMVTLVAAQAALKEAEKAVASSQKSADETAVLYRQGIAKAIELVDANDQVFLAEVNRVSAEYSMAQAYIALRQALGLMPIGTELK